ncbi:MAG: T9SS type A sorting domain-containing protein [Salibacteraceae bacterium]
MKYFLTITILLFSLVLCAQVQPQFKFYLAFEDAKHEKDTVWIVIDSNGSDSLFDTLLGESSQLLDSTAFQVWLITNQNDSVLKTIAFPIRSSSSISYSILVKSRNSQYPITIRWDTNLLKNHTLPFELKQATLYNNNYLILDKTVDLFKSDSVMLPEFTVGGGAGNHFPLILFLSNNEPPDDVGIKNTISDAFSVYPKPASTVLNVDRNDHEQCSYFIIDLLGKTHQAGRLQSFPAQINLSHFQTGNYILVLKDTKTISYESILILK